MIGFDRGDERTSDYRTKSDGIEYSHQKIRAFTVSFEQDDAIDAEASEVIQLAHRSELGPPVAEPLVTCRRMRLLPRDFEHRGYTPN